MSGLYIVYIIHIQKPFYLQQQKQKQKICIVFKYRSQRSVVTALLNSKSHCNNTKLPQDNFSVQNVEYNM